MKSGSLEHGNTFRKQRGRKKRGIRVRKDYGSCQEFFSGQSQTLPDLESDFDCVISPPYQKQGVSWPAKTWVKLPEVLVML